MDQLKNLVSNLSKIQMFTIAAAVLLVVGGLYGFVNWRRDADFKPLYTGMAAEDAGAVVQKIKETGNDYRLAESGGTVLVRSERLPEIRLALAAAGLPKSGRIGFELFDKTNFGATEFVEHINYRRALEGELERSVMSLAEVQQARVHITFSKDSVYLDNQQPAKASVLVKLQPGARLAPQNITAITHLVANAVEGLTPEAVSVLDMRGTLLSRQKKASSEAELDNENLEYRRKLEQDLVAKINTTLEPLLGPDRFRAGASVECDFTNNEETLESFDPEHSVMLSSQKTEDSTTSSAGAFGGMPGTASSLPRPAASPSGSPSSLSRRTENVTYQTSKTTRHIRQPQGTIKRISVSVLLDHNVHWEGKKKVIMAPPAETIKSIREVIAGVTAISEERGDQLIVESLPFESTLNQEPPAAPVAPVRTQPDMKVILIAAAGAVVLIVVVVALMMRSRRSPRKRVLAVAGDLALPEAATPAAAAREVPAGQPAASQIEGALSAPPELEAPKLPSTEEILQHIRELAAKDATAPAGVVRMWLSQTET